MSVKESVSEPPGNLRRSKRLVNQDSVSYSITKKFKKSKNDINDEILDSISTISSVKKCCDSISNSDTSSCLCEKCDNQFPKKADKKDKDKTSKCSPCKKTIKNLSNEYIEDTNKTCENCKETILSADYKMMGCLICMKFYHINCLLPSDLPHDLKFEPGQLIRRKLGCMRCAVVHLCYKVDSIITWKYRKDASQIDRPEKYFMSREFLIHYSNMSYWDCEWVSEVQLEISETNLYRAYKRKCLDFVTQPILNVLSESHKRKLSEIEIKLYEKYFQYSIDPDWLQPQKVLEMDEVGCFVKWRGLGYDYVSTEPLSRVSEIDGLQEAIDKHKRLITELKDGLWQCQDKSKLTKLMESPDYLGPDIVGNKDKPHLHPYQLEGVNWLRSSYSNCVNTILADEMGLGKTIQAIALLYSLYKEKVSHGPFLIAVPLSTIKNWEREFEFWAPELCVVLYYGDKDARQIIREKDMYLDKKKKNIAAFHVLITTFELIFMDENSLIPINWEILIVDEAHRLKNKETKLFKSLKKYHINYRILMTGTPLQNNLEELFHLLNFMQPNSFGDMASFLSQFQDVSKEEQVRTLQDMVKKHILRRLKVDVFDDLPSKEEQIVRVELTPFQKNIYKIILSKNYECLIGKFSGIKMTNIMMQLRKCCNHPYLLSNEIANENLLEDGSYNMPSLIAASGKTSILETMLFKLRKTGHKVLIFSGMTRMLDILEYLLEHMNIQFERIDGSVSSLSRQNAIDRFNDPDSVSMVFLLSTKAGGLGINLCSADTVFIYDADWNPQNDIQALSRAHRIGQTKKVMIYRFVTRNSIEEKIMESAKRKMMMTNLVVKSFTKVEFHQILSFGTKDLFDENDDKNDQKIIYDDAAIDQLLDRNRVEVKNSENSFVDSCFSGFKMAQYQFASELQGNRENKEVKETKKNIVESTTSVIDNPSDYWNTLLEPFLKNNPEENKDEPILGKGLRQKKKINYVTQEIVNDNQTSPVSNNGVDQKDPDDTDYDISEGENFEMSSVDHKSDDSYSLNKTDKKTNGVHEGNKLPSKFNFDRDFKDLANYGITGELTTQKGIANLNESNVMQFKHFSIIDGFMPKERMEIYHSLMNYGLPPKILKKGDIWYPCALGHKTVEEIDNYITTLMISLYESNDPSLSIQEDQVLQDDIDYDLLLARIGLMTLINHKVNQFECTNRTILEMVTYKHWNITIVTNEELETLFDELKYFEFDLKFYDGGFSKIHKEWNEYYSKLTKQIPINPTLKWNKLHDYYLLSAIASHGYDRYMSVVFQDPQYQILFIPFRMNNLDIIKDNNEIRKSLRNRQNILENALLLETQIMKVGSAFDGYTMDFFSTERLSHYHDLFVKQGNNNYVTSGFANSKSKISAIAQLELLINDIDSDWDTYRPITIKTSDSTNTIPSSI